MSILMCFGDGERIQYTYFISIIVPSIEYKIQEKWQHVYVVRCLNVVEPKIGTM